MSVFAPLLASKGCAGEKNANSDRPTTSSERSIPLAIDFIVVSLPRLALPNSLFSVRWAVRECDPMSGPRYVVGKQFDVPDVLYTLEWEPILQQIWEPECRPAWPRLHVIWDISFLLSYPAMRMRRSSGAVVVAIAICVSACAGLWAQQLPSATEGDYVAHDFHFRSGEVLPEIRLHYRTIGQPARDANGHVTNAVMIVHGTGGNGAWFLRNESFTGELFGPGQLLDVTRYYVILPDALGHGKSSKPSDGLRARFPHYDYDDMVEAERLLLTESLRVDHLRLFMGMSMGCMHAFLFAEKYPDFLDAAMPLACSVVEIGGRNRILRKVVMDSIRNDPRYKNGDYEQQPAGLRTALGIMLVETTSSIKMQQAYPTREMADQRLKEFVDTLMATNDANDVLYAWDASRSYDPSKKLDQIKATVMWVNSADDAVNPPELGIAETQIRKIKRGRFVLLPISDLTRGHATNSYPLAWRQYLADLLKQTEH